MTNRYSMEAFKSMIHDKDITMHLWDEEANTIVRVQKKISHIALGNKTLKEMFTLQNPEVVHLKIIGFPIYLHVPKDKISKLDPSRKNGIFFGYSDQSKSYEIYIPCFLQIEVSIDFAFDEDVAFINSRNTHVDEVYEQEK